MRFTSISLLLLILSLYACQEAPVVDENTFISKMDEEIPALLEEFITPGASLALIENGEIVHMAPTLLAVFRVVWVSR